jgi:hypothetical protein
VDPAEMPKICVCTAPDTPIVHVSVFELLIAGLIAEGGGERKVVTESEVDLTVLSVFDSVTIV